MRWCRARARPDISSGKPAESPVVPMKSNPTKKVVAVKMAPRTLQQFFDKWFLPVLFVAIGSLMVWALWRH